MSERMTTENQVPVSLPEEIEVMLAVGGLSPAQRSTFERAAKRITELEAQLCAANQHVKILNESEAECFKRINAGLKLADKWERGFQRNTLLRRNPVDCAHELRETLGGNDG